MEQETWVAVKGFEDLYEISNLGRIKRLISIKCKKERFLTASFSTTGYYFIRLYKFSKGHSFKLHRLIAQAFIPNPENKPFINHINGIKTDNSIQNLEWCTGKENSDHAAKTGLHDIRGEKHFAAKMTEQEVIALIADHKSKKFKIKELQKKYGLAKSSLLQIVMGLRWKHLIPPTSNADTL